MLHSHIGLSLSAAITSICGMSLMTPRPTFTFHSTFWFSAFWRFHLLPDIPAQYPSVLVMLPASFGLVLSVFAQSRDLLITQALPYWHLSTRAELIAWFSNERIPSVPCVNLFPALPSFSTTFMYVRG